MKKAKFLVSHFDASVEKYKAGEVYDLTEDTRLCIARGAAVEVEVEVPPPGPDRATLEAMLAELPKAIAEGTAPKDANGALQQLRGSFADLVTVDDEAAVRGAYEAAAEAAKAAEAAAAEKKAADEKAAAEKKATDDKAAETAAGTGKSKK